MILNLIIKYLFDTVKLILNPLPDVPATPSAITTGANWIVDTIHTVISVFRVIYTGTLLDAIILIVIGMFVFEWTYHTIMWIVRKIPMVNIK